MTKRPQRIKSITHYDTRDAAAENSVFRSLIKGDADIIYARPPGKVIVTFRTMGCDGSSVNCYSAFVSFVNFCVYREILLPKTPRPDGLFHMIDGYQHLNANALPSVINITNGTMPGDVSFYGKGTDEECTNYLSLIESFVLYSTECGG